MPGKHPTESPQKQLNYGHRT